VVTSFHRDTAGRVLEAFSPAERDLTEVAECLGREPTIAFRVAARYARTGEILVIESLPVASDGSPNPNWMWLVHRSLKKVIDRLEASGGVKRAERAVGEVGIARSHALYRSGRNALCAELGLEPLSGGVGGARVGVKCLHAHVAFHLAGGYSPVGRWALSEIGSGDYGEVSVGS
jgi:hypothetical protein